MPKVTFIRDAAPTTAIVRVSNPADEAKEASFSGTWSSGLNSAYTLSPSGATTLGVHIQPATNGAIIFEGSWDGEIWTDFTMRQMGSHGYASTTTEHEDWMGSVSTLRYVRFRTTTAGTGSHRCEGKFTCNPSVIEGIEHGNQPHRIGSTVTAKMINLSTGCTNFPIWTPVSGHRLVVSDIHFTVTDANTVVTITDGSMADSAFIFHGHFKPPSGESVYVPVSFSLPHVFASTDSVLRITATGKPTVQGVVHGYEAE